jgi:protein-tyrosine phosphatase
MAGISRSVTIVTAYLIKKFKYSLEEVLHIMQRKRSKVIPSLKQVNPNRGFVEQLRNYALREGVRHSLKISFSQKKEKN